METTIKIKVVDQELAFIESPFVASGNINTVVTVFSFDESWEGFTKTAVFYRDKGDPKLNILKDDKCYVRQEVMQTDGRMFIGVFGVKDDKVKTSEIVFYDIGVGVPTSGAIEEPSDEIWQQILNELGNIRELAEQMKLDQEAFETDITKKQEDFESDITKIQSDFEIKVTKKQNNFETEITERQESFEQRVENKTGYTKDEADERFIHTALQGTFETDLAEEYKGVASDYGAEIIKIEGKSEQGSTNGYQLLNPDLFDEDKVDNGLHFTKQEDGSIVLSGSLADGKIATYRLGDYINTLEDRKTYCYTSDGNAGVINIIYKDGSHNGYVSTVTVDKSTMKSIQPYIQFNSTLPVKKHILKPMFNEGDKIKPFEVYSGGIPSPNPNYPQEINNALDKPLVSVGRNLFDASKIKTKSQGGATVTNNGDGSFTISGSGNLTESFFNEYKVVGNEEIKKLLKVGKLSLKNNSGIKTNETNPYFHIYLSDKANERLLVLMNGNTKEVTQDILNKSEILVVSLWGSSGEAIQGGTIKPMLYQEGDGEWEPFRYAETNLNFQRMCSVPDGTCDTYENGVSTQRIALYGFNGGNRENWISEKCDIGNRFMIDLPQIQKAMPSHIGQETSINSALPLGKSGATFNTKNCYTINNNKLYVSLNGTETLEEFKEYLSNNEMQLLYKLETPIVLEVEKRIVPTFYPYTNIFQSDSAKAKIQYALRSKADKIEKELKEHENEINTKLDSYKVKGDFAVINSNINLTNGDGQLDLSYPSGFNKDNCVCIAAGLAFQNAIGYIFNDYPYGSFEVRFKTDRITCIVGDNGQVTGPTGAKPIRIVLMKV